MAVIIEYPFEARYEVEVLDQIRRDLGISKVLGYPGAYAVHAQQVLNNGPILAVTPSEGEPWIGVFGGSNTTSRVLNWPGGRSLCVVDGTTPLSSAQAPRMTGLQSIATRSRTHSLSQSSTS